MVKVRHNWLPWWKINLLFGKDKCPRVFRHWIFPGEYSAWLMHFWGKKGIIPTSHHCWRSQIRREKHNRRISPEERLSTP